VQAAGLGTGGTTHCARIETYDTGAVHAVVTQTLLTLRLTAKGRQDMRQQHRCLSNSFTSPQQLCKQRSTTAAVRPVAAGVEHLNTQPHRHAQLHEATHTQCCTQHTPDTQKRAHTNKHTHTLAQIQALAHTRTHTEATG
jgi:hypothetical protein